MQIRVLGSIEAANGDQIALGGATQRRLLAVLALDSGEVVSLDRLVDLSWPDGEAPAQAERNVRTYIHRLRSAFGSDLADRIETVEPGYRLHLERGELDADRFDELASSAARLAGSGDHTGALEIIDEAAGLWQGRPFGEFADEEWAAVEVDRLTEVRTGTRELRAEILTELGRHADAIGDLEELIAAAPLRERPRALHMQALHAAGRQVDALRAFQDFRSLLVEEIGVEPSPELVELDRAIASGEASRLPAGSPTRKVGAYELQEEIGEGAFAVVYRAIQTGLDRPVAIKAIRAELANRPEFIRRFEAEAHMVARLEHPHIVPLYDYWREPDRAYLVMRWLPGGTLEQSLDAGPWSLERTAKMVEQVGSALAIAHRAGVIHRDVKPANIVLDADGNTFLSDFGIALGAEERFQPAAALSHGSPAYASPEQLRKEPAGPPADIHGLAIAVYETLTAELPFGDGVDPTTALRLQLNEPIPQISTRLPEFPAEVDHVLQRAAAKDPRHRYQHVHEFVDAFTAAVAGRDAEPTRPARSLTLIAGELENPYKGLRAFDETDSDDFFGRERLIDELVGKMNGDGSGSRLLAVVGPSGSGKSSVVRAGLLPALRRGAVPGSDEWFVTTMHPGAHPFEQLETALLRIAVNPPASLLDQLSAGPRGILRGVQRALPDDSTRLLLVIDQFEELFTLCEDDSVRSRFLAGLVAAATEPDSPIRVVLTLRADFFDRPLRYPEFANLMKQNSVTVTPLAGDELEHAIVDPAARLGVEFEGGLVAEIVAEVAGQPGALPLMQYALTELFDTQVSRLLLLDSYRELGGLSGALARRADDLYESVSPDEQTAIRALFGRLTTPGEGTEDTRRRVRLSEASIDDATEAVIDAYGSARLLTFDRDPVTREPTVEVAHEALIREWPRLRSWLDDDRQGLRVHRHLTTSAAAWADGGRDDGELYRGVRLEAAEEWTTSAAPALNPLEDEFLTASVDNRNAEEQAERNRIRRLRRLLITTGIVAVVALVAGAIAFREQQRADDQAALAAANEARAVTNAEQAADNEALATANADRAEESAALAAQRAEEAETARAQADLERVRALALATAPENPELAALLAVEAHTIDPSLTSLDVLHRVLTAVPGFRGSIIGGPYQGASLLDDGVTLAAVGPESIDVWDLRSRETTLSIPHEVGSEFVRMDSTGDGRVLAVGAGADQTRLYDLGTGEVLGSMTHTAPVNDISLSNDGSRLVAARADGLVEIWDLEIGDVVTQLDTGAAGASFARWSPAEDRIAVVTGTSELQFWDPVAAEPLWTADAPTNLAGQVFRPFGVLFSSDGQHLVLDTGVQDGQLRVHETGDGALAFPPAPRPAEGFVVDDPFWVDEDALIVASPARQGIQSVDLRTGEVGDIQIQSRQVATSATYSPVLDRLVSVGPEGLEIWSVDGSGPLERVAPLSAEQQDAVANDQASVNISLSDDGSRLLVSVVTFVGLPRPTLVFDLTRDPLAAEIFDPAGTVTIGYGAYTLTASFLTGVGVLGPDHEPLGPPVLGPLDITDVAASPDGRFFAIGRLNGFIDLYTTSGDLVANLSMVDEGPLEGAIPGPNFSDDGRWLSANDAISGSSALWSTETLERIDAPPGGRMIGKWYLMRSGADVTLHDQETFEPGGDPLIGARSTSYYATDVVDNRWIASPQRDVVRVWDVESGQQIGRELPYHSNRVEFTGDGSILAVGTEDRVTLWNFDTDTWAGIACELAGRNMTQGEWDQLGPREIERRATCPQFPLP